MPEPTPLRNERLDFILIRQKDFILKQLSSLESSFNLDRAQSLRKQLELVRELWVECNYEYKLEEILLRFNALLNSRT